VAGPAGRLLSAPVNENEQPKPGPGGRDGNLVADELIWIHDSIRRDLGLVRELAADVAAGAEPGEVRERIDSMRTNGPLWKLKVNCLHYCRFVHHHHQLEDTMLFPFVRQARPGSETIIDRLENDHAELVDILDAVTDASGELDDEADAATRQAVVDALERLARYLTEHLEFEEENFVPLLRTITADEITSGPLAR